MLLFCWRTGHSSGPLILELGEDVCFFNLNDHPFDIAKQIVKYLESTKTHKLFRSVMERHILDMICKKEIIPFLKKIVSHKRE